MHLNNQLNKLKFLEEYVLFDFERIPFGSRINANPICLSVSCSLAPSLLLLINQPTNRPTIHHIAHAHLECFITCLVNIVHQLRRWLNFFWSFDLFIWQSELGILYEFRTANQYRFNCRSRLMQIYTHVHCAFHSYTAPHSYTHHMHLHIDASILSYYTYIMYTNAGGASHATLSYSVQHWTSWPIHDCIEGARAHTVQFMICNYICYADKLNVKALEPKLDAAYHPHTRAMMMKNQLLISAIPLHWFDHIYCFSNIGNST